MKKTLLTMALVAASLAAFAQGKVNLAQDGGALITLNSNTRPQDSAYAGQPVPTNMPSGVTLEVGLFGGATAGALTLQTSELLYPNGGLPNGWEATEHAVTSFPGYTAGQAAYFQVVVWDSAFATPAAALAAGSYYGADNVFSMTPGTGITYPNCYSGGNTTWAAVGDEAPLMVGIAIPEPATFALAGLGAAAMVIFRRRK